MIGPPDQPEGGESEGASQVKELSSEIKERLPETKLDLTPNSKEEKQEIRFARKININEADIDKLQEIPNVGINTAQAIIQFREEDGKFYRIEDLNQIDGIGKKTVEELQPHITVGKEYKEKAPAEEETGKIDIN
ncbi:MAG: ComEA family DNA-binding protein, partial [bacterium]